VWNWSTAPGTTTKLTSHLSLSSCPAISIGSVPCTSAAPYSQKKPGSSRLSDSMSDVNSVFHNTMNVGLTNVLVQLVSLHSSGPTSWSYLCYVKFWKYKNVCCLHVR
jgi:hypothetical protein